MAQAKSAARKPRRKEKKNIAVGQAHIKSTFNNTIRSARATVRTSRASRSPASSKSQETQRWHTKRAQAPP
ncbi:hypothetical protein NP565_23460, partial [Vibrio parahaemolyticus]|nr:hypothetical protein [Vibrio parahaemolyticus]